MYSKIKLLTICILGVTTWLFARDQIVFPHDYHIGEEELECTLCHEDVYNSKSLGSSLLPKMDVCSECHDTDDDCELCHTNPDDPLSFPLFGNTSGKDFSHLFHLDRFTDCTTCHSSILADDGQGDRPVWESWKCTTCHQSNKPTDHDLAWKSFHGMDVAAVSETRCQLCHTEIFCEDCHSYQQFEPASHPVNYIYQHSFEARAETFECSTCHNIDNDCRKCHNEQMVFPTNHSLIQWYVPTDILSGGLHGDEAINNPDNCQVCHSTTSCMGCHGGNE
mgnify:CR=1 FL=1